jgi:molybdopterin-binding protein
MDADGNWLWASQAGGSGSDEGYEITLDDAGNSYVTGYFEGTATFDSYSLTSSGYSDIFVAKMDTDGNWLWASQAGGNSDDEGYGITVDDSGNSYVTGYFEGTATFGAYSLTSSGYSDIFVAKMDAGGNWLWAFQAGGSDDDHGKGITIDDAGNSYVTGYFCGIATFGSHSLTSTGESNIFIAKTDADGNWLWANRAGSNTDNYGRSIIVDNAGNSYTIGDFEGTATFGTYTLYSNQCSDIFVSKIDTDGNWLWVSQAGGNSYDEGNSIALDDAGNSYVTGCFSETAMFGSHTITSNGYFDIFVAKIDDSGNWLWAIQASGTYEDSGYGITIDDVGNYYVTGAFEGTATFGSYSIYSNGETDIFVAKLGSILSAENDILSFQIPEQIGETVIDNVEHTVQLDVPSGTNVTALIPTIEISDFATIDPESGTPQDFTQPVEYTVTAQNGDEQIWIVTVSILPSGENDIISFTIPEQIGDTVIDDVEHTVQLDVPAGTNVTALIPTIEISDFATIDPASGTPQNFTQPVEYTVTAENGDEQIWTVTVTLLTSSDDDLTPDGMELISNFPNPFNPSTTISFSVAQTSSFVTLDIYNIKGQKVKTLINDRFDAGAHQVVWDGKDDNNKPVSSGIYFYKLKAGNFEQTKKMILLK